MILRWALAVLILPFNVLVVVPGLLLYAFRGGACAHAWAHPGGPRFILAVLLALLGLEFAFLTVGLFVRHGEGTAAPWDPPKKFVVRGPYLHRGEPALHPSLRGERAREEVRRGLRRL